MDSTEKKYIKLPTDACGVAADGRRCYLNGFDKRTGEFWGVPIPETDTKIIIRKPSDQETIISR